MNSDMNMRLGNGNGLGFGHVMVKHEQELLQRQQLYQPQQYPALNPSLIQPLPPPRHQQQQQLQHHQTPSSYPSKNTLPLEHEFNANPLVIQPLYYNTAMNQTPPQSFNFPLKIGNGANGLVVPTEPYVQSNITSYSSEGGNNFSHWNNTASNSSEYNNSGIPMHNKIQLPSASILDRPQHSNPVPGTVKQYASLPQQYPIVNAMSRPETHTPMHHYEQLQNLQHLQLQQVRLQAQTQTLSHNIHNTSTQSTLHLQPLNLKPRNNSISTSTAYHSENSNEESERYYQCHLCEKRFKRKSWLKRHLLSHSNVKKFHCPWCASTHKRKDNLLQHLKVKHTQHLLREFAHFGISMNVNNGSGNTASLVTTSNNEKVWVVNDDPSLTIRDMLDSNILPKDQVKRCLNYIVDGKCK